MREIAGQQQGANRRGGTIIYLVVGLVCLMLLGSLAVDYGRMQVAKSEVQTAAMAAARAGGQTMINGGDMTTVLADAIATARMNSIDGVPVTIRAGDVKLGIYFPDTKDFVETSDTTMANALRIDLTHEFGRDSGPLSFIPSFSTNTHSVHGRATIMIQSDSFDPNAYTYLLSTPGTSGGTPGTPGSTTTTTETTTTTTTTVITEADAGTIVATWTPVVPPPPEPTPAPPPPPAPEPTPVTTTTTETTTTTVYIPPTPDTTWSTPGTTTTVTVVEPPPPPAPKKMVVVN